MDKLKIVAVDDNAVNLATIEQALQEEYDVLAMIAGKRAVKYLGKQKADLMLLDVQMPEMDGIETLTKVRELENGVNLPVIFLSAAKDEDTVKAGERLGIRDYITKPFDPEDLKLRIQKALA